MDLRNIQGSERKTINESNKKMCSERKASPHKRPLPIKILSTGWSLNNCTRWVDRDHTPYTPVFIRSLWNS